jgi:hypothetical protein
MFQDFGLGDENVVYHEELIMYVLNFIDQIDFDTDVEGFVQEIPQSIVRLL